MYYKCIKINIDPEQACYCKFNRPMGIESQEGGIELDSVKKNS